MGLRTFVAFATFVMAFLSPILLAVVGTAEITISRNPNTPPLEKLAIRLPGDATTVSLIVYAHNNTDKKVDASFYFQLLDLQEQPLVDVKIQFDSPGSKDGKTPIEAHSLVAVTMNVVDLKVFGEFKGALNVDIGSGPKLAFPITIERNPIPQLQIAGTQAGALALTAESSPWKQLLQIESTNSSKIENLRVLIGPLTGPSGERIQPTWTLDGKLGSAQSTPILVPPHGAVDLQIEAVLKTAGDYKGALTLLYGDKREPIALTVKRERKAASIEILEIAPVGFTRGVGGNSAFRLTIQETSGSDVKLSLPKLVGVYRKETPQSKSSGSMSISSIYDDAGNDVQDPFVLKSDQSTTLIASLDHLDGAGEYAGTLRVTHANGPPTDKPVTILIRDPMWLATLLILIGVGSSHWIRQWQNRWRPRLIAQRDIQALLATIESISIEANPSAIEIEPLESLRQQLEESRTQVKEKGVPATFDADIKLFGEKISLYPDWLNRQREVEAMRPVTLATDLQLSLNTIREYLTNATDKSDSKVHRTTLTELPAQIIKVLGTDFDTQLNDFRNKLSSHRVRVSVVGKTFLKQIDDSLHEAQIHREKNEFIHARKSFDIARSDYVRLLLHEFDEQLSGPLPNGFENAEWTSARERFRREMLQLQPLVGTNPDQAMETYKTLVCQLIDDLARKEKEQAPTLTKALERIQDAEKKKAALEKLDAAVKSLSSAAEKAAQGDSAGATTDYNAGHQKFSDCQGLLPSLGGQQGVIDKLDVSNSTPSALSTGTSLVASAGQSQFQTIASRSVAVHLSVIDLKKRLTTGDRWFTCLLFVIASLIGVNMFWVGNPTWGGWPAWATALIWGLGVHQASGTALDLAALGEKLK